MAHCNITLCRYADTETGEEGGLIKLEPPCVEVTLERGDGAVASAIRTGDNAAVDAALDRTGRVLNLSD